MTLLCRACMSCSPLVVSGAFRPDTAAACATRRADMGRRDEDSDSEEEERRRRKERKKERRHEDVRWRL